MTKSRFFAALLLVATFTVSGCVVRARGGVYVPAPSVGVVVYEEPPPPRVTYVAPRPGFLWIEGHWYRRGNNWAWYDGRWERERTGYVYAPGRWERRGNGRVWVDGRWNARAGYRTGNPNVQRDNRGGGVITRDHR